MVEVDCLTGEHQLLRTDIVMDVGRSLNPAIDIGQIEGAFVQGCGYVTMEEIIHSKQGGILNNNLSTYKVIVSQLTRDVIIEKYFRSPEPPMFPPSSM